MSLAGYCILRATIQLNVPVNDGAFGQTASWVDQGSWQCRMETLTAKDTLRLGREAHEILLRLQGNNALPTRVQGNRTMQALLMDQTIERVRLIVEGRKFQILGFHLCNNGNVGPDVMNINVLDFTRATGYTDK